MVKKIFLNKGQYSIVDDEDFDRANQFKWYLQDAAHGPNYAIRRACANGKYRTVYLHRFIIGAQKGQFVDHVNCDGLDNRRSNLRIANASENGRNRNIQSNNTSGYKGVYPTRSHRKWVASICINGKNIRVGRFCNVKDAARAYNEAALKYYGKFARLNDV